MKKLLLLALLFSVTAQAQVGIYRLRARYYRSNYTPSSHTISSLYAVQSTNLLYERITSLVSTGLVQQHFWSTQTCPECFWTTGTVTRTTGTNGTQSIQTIFEQGRSSSSPPADMGTIAYPATNAGTLHYFVIRSASTWITKPYTNDATDWRLRIEYQHSNSTPILYADFHIYPSNSYVLTPSIACLTLNMGGQPWETGSYPDYVKGMGILQNSWGLIGSGGLCAGSPDVDLPAVPSISQIQGWTNSQSAFNVSLDLQDQPLMLSVPNPCPSCPTNGWTDPVIDESRPKHLSFSATPGRIYLIQSTDDGLNWDVCGMGEETSEGNYEFTDKRLSHRMRLFKVIQAE